MPDSPSPQNIGDGGPAFPAAAYWPYPGMSLRQHYAGLAMQTLIGQGGWGYDDAAEEALCHADALLAALNKDRTDDSDAQTG